MIETLASTLQAIGVTRINAIHGYEDLPVFVYQTCRPLAVHIKTDSGKGLTPEKAYVSAAVESIERYCAENLANPSQSRRLSELPSQLVDRYLANYSSKCRLECIDAIDLCDNKAVYLPRDIISYDIFSCSQLRPIFPNGTTGLGGHIDLRLAQLSGILEVLERDAIASRILVPFEPPKTALTKYLVQSVLKKVPSIQISKYSSRWPIHVYEIRSACDEVNGGFTAFGAGLTNEEALIDALIEAMQTWILRVSASRDDWAYSLSDAIPIVHATQTITSRSNHWLPSHGPVTVPASDCLSDKYDHDFLGKIIEHARLNNLAIFACELFVDIEINPVRIVKVVIPSAKPLRQGPMLTGFPTLPA